MAGGLEKRCFGGVFTAVRGGGKTGNFPAYKEYKRAAGKMRAFRRGESGFFPRA
jgi:hypothetical protein